MPILTDIARFVGDDIAVVAAVDEDTAAEAIELIKVEYRAPPFVLDPEEALQANAPKLYAEGNLIGGRPTVVSRGDLAKGFAEADLIYEGRYRTPMLHMPRPRAGVRGRQREAGSDFLPGFHARHV